MSNVTCYFHCCWCSPSVSTWSRQPPVWPKNSNWPPWAQCAPMEKLCNFLLMKYHRTVDTQFRQSAMMQVVNKMLPLVSTEPNIINPDKGGIQLQVFCHSFQVKNRSNLFWITPKVRVTSQCCPASLFSQIGRKVADWNTQLQVAERMQWS